MSETFHLTSIVDLQERRELIIEQTKEEVLSVMHARDLVMSEPNVQTTSRIKGKVCQ